MSSVFENVMNPATDTLFQYLHDAIYDPANADLDIDTLPDDYKDIGSVLQHYTRYVNEAIALASGLSKGNLDVILPSHDNAIAAPLKSLHASLKYLTWQVQQIAQGDYEQRIDFMGEFSDSFNIMIEQLRARESHLKEKIDDLETQAYKDNITNLYNRAFGMCTLNSWLREKRQFVVIFSDLDRLKYVNDKFGHREGDLYILNASKYLSSFSKNAVVCRIGGDEFLVLAQNFDYASAIERMNKIYNDFQQDEYLADKAFTYSISFGVAYVDKNNKLSASDILSIADERMYENKRLRKKERQQVQK
ncbi:MAG: diguanylate cyclase [Oscillospiraceae bacterium]|nr:diguanylate cyclase [Oscillospiraceae bacterium]